jgi:hypothetical protein
VLKGFKGIPSARKSITYVLSQLPAIEASLDYDQGRIGPYTFQPALNMKMMAPSPPRTVNMLSVTQVIHHFAVARAQSLVADFLGMMLARDSPLMTPRMVSTSARHAHILTLLTRC